MRYKSTDERTYSKTTLTPTADEVLIGGSTQASIDNLIAAITLTGTSGTDYAAATVLHPSVTARAAPTGTIMECLSKAHDTDANSISTTDPTDGGGVMSWGATTLASGARSFYNIAIEADSATTTNVRFGESPAADVGSSGLIISANAVLGRRDQDKRWELIVDDVDIDLVEFYGCTFAHAADIHLGNATVLPATSVAMYDNTMVDTHRIIRNVDPTGQLFFGNKVVNSVESPSLNILDTLDMLQEDWALISSFGLQTDEAAKQYTDFNDVNNVEILHILVSNQIVTYLNPVQNIDEAKVIWAGSPDGEWHEEYSFLPTVKDTTGTAIAGARTYVADDDTISTFAVQETTDASGLVVSTFRQRDQVDDATVTERGPFTSRILAYDEGGDVGIHSTGDRVIR